MRNKTSDKMVELRANMLLAVNDLIKQSDWTQKEAAEKLNVTQTRISNMKNGKTGNMKVDTLMSMLNKFGFTFEFNYTKPVTITDFDVSMSVKSLES